MGFVSKPKVGAERLPWESADHGFINTNGVAIGAGHKPFLVDGTAATATQRSPANAGQCWAGGWNAVGVRRIRGVMFGRRDSGDLFGKKRGRQQFDFRRLGRESLVAIHRVAGRAVLVKVSVVKLSPVHYFDSMSTEIMERSLADLQRRVEKLEATSRPVAKDGWREVIGFAKDDDLFREAMKLGAEWRVKANQKGR